jgi:signal transduction histidine kinase
VTTPRSLRSRVVVGAILWAVGTVAIGHLLAVLLMHRFPVHFAHWSAVSFVALATMVAGIAQVRSGLSPFNRLRARLAAVREGRDRRVEGSYPAEVQPLVHDLNALLDDRERRIGQALAKAGDLAHGLKTPLAVLAQEAERAQAGGHAELAGTINQQVERMRRQVDYHLAHARAAASGAAPGVTCRVVTSVEGLVRTLLRLHDGRGLVIDVQADPEHVVRAWREALDEMLGNLLDNACKWAKSRIQVASSRSAGRVAIVVDDDGPGLDPSMRETVLQRGVRADEAAPGSGFGLAIVRDLAELHGGSIVLSQSPAGGLRARLELPAG